MPHDSAITAPEFFPQNMKIRNCFWWLIESPMLSPDGFWQFFWKVADLYLKGSVGTSAGDWESFLTDTNAF